MSDNSSALVAALNGEFAAIYAYGVIGAHLKGAAQALATQAESDHRDLRDRITMAMSSPPAAAVVYRMPAPVTDRGSALAAAVTVEQRVAALWRQALAATTGDTRKTALDALIAGAVRTTEFRRLAGTLPGTVPFPGLTG